MTITIDDLRKAKELLELDDNSIIKQKVRFLKIMNPDANQDTVDSVNVNTVFILPDRLRGIEESLDYVRTSKLIDDMIMVDEPEDFIFNVMTSTFRL